jgi:hypothetical protein
MEIWVGNTKGIIIWPDSGASPFLLTSQFGKVTIHVEWVVVSVESVKGSLGGQSLTSAGGIWSTAWSGQDGLQHIGDRQKHVHPWTPHWGGWNGNLHLMGT